MGCGAVNIRLKTISFYIILKHMELQFLEEQGLKTIFFYIILKQIQKELREVNA